MALSSLFVEIGGGIAGLRTAMGEAVTEIKSVEKASGESSAALQRGAKVGTVAAVALGAGLLAVGVESVKMAADFETTNNKLVSTAGESAGVLRDVVGPGILKMAGDVGYSAHQLSEGMYTVESGGFHGAAGLNLLKAAAQGAKAENADLGTVTNALTTVMQDYKGAITDPSVAMSQLVAITGTGKMSFQDLASSLSAVLPKAASLGIGLGQLGGAVATLTQHGESAELATQHLNHTIGALNQPLGPARAGMQQFGIDVQDLTLNMGDDKRGLVGTVGLLQDAIVKKMGPAGTIAIDTLKKSSQGAKDAADMIKSMPPELAKMSQGFLDGSTTGAAYTKFIKGLGADGLTMGQNFKGLVASSHGFSDALKSGKPEIVNFAGALKQIGGDQTTSDTLMQLMGKNYEEYSQNVKTASDATKDANGNVKGFADTQDTLNFKLDSAKASFGALSISIGNALLPVAKVAADVLAGVAHWLAENSMFAMGLGVVLAVIVTGAIATFVANSVTGLAKVGESLVKATAKFVVWVWERSFGYATVATEAEVAAGAEEGSMVKRSAGLVRNAASGAVWVAQKTAHYVAVAGAAVANAAVTAATWAVEATKTAASAVASGAIWVATKIGQYAAVAGGAVLQAGIASAAWIAENIVAIAATGGIILVIGLLVAGIMWLVSHWDDVKRVAGIVWDWVEARFEAAKVWIGQRIDDIVNFFKGIGRLWDIAVDAMNKVNTAIGDGIRNVIDWFVALPGRILGAIGDFGHLLWNVGVNLVIGLWNGLASMGTWLWNTIMGWIKSVVPGPILSALGIASPSKLTHWIGQMTGEGLGNGMIASAKFVTDASKTLGNAAASGLVPGQPGSPLTSAVNGAYALSGAAVSAAAPLGGSGAGLSTGGLPSGSGSNVTVIQVQGSIVDAQGVFDAVQKVSTRTNGRNVTNGLSTVRV